MCRALKAPNLARAVPRLAERARAEGWGHEEFLAACLEREVAAPRVVENLGGARQCHHVGRLGRHLANGCRGHELGPVPLDRVVRTQGSGVDKQRYARGGEGLPKRVDLHEAFGPPRRSAWVEDAPTLEPRADACAQAFLPGQHASESGPAQTGIG